MDLFIITSLNHIYIRSCLIQPNNKLISNDEQLSNAMDLLSLTFSIILPSNPRGKISTTSQINLGTTDKNKNTKVHTIKKLLDSSASASIVHKDTLYERHRILKNKKNKW